MKRILLTGAAGIVGSAIRPLLAGRHDHIRLTDIAALPGDQPLAENESFERGDITDREFVKNLMREVDGVVHLAGLVGPDFTFDEVYRINMAGDGNVFSAAQSLGVNRVVYASSHHAVGYLERGQPIDETSAPRPDSFYGLSKAFGEAVASFYAHRFGMQVMAIRIGYAGDEVPDERRLHIWISPRDLVQLIGIGLETPGLGFQIVYGASILPDSFFDNRNAERLGYRPVDRAVDHLANPGLLSARPEGKFVGGHFAG